jgi:hypothetical protein
MEDREERGAVRNLERVRADVSGGAFPRPPMLPVVATLTLFVGLSLGMALAPRAPTPTTATATQFGAPFVAPTAPPSPGTLETTAFATALAVQPASPPPGGIAVSQAIAAAEEAYGISDADIVDVSLVDNSETYSDPSRAHLWSWQIQVRTSVADCSTPIGVRIVLPGGSPASVTFGYEPGSSPEVVTIASPDVVTFYACGLTGTITVDYLTGRVVSMFAEQSWSIAGPPGP